MSRNTGETPMDFTWQNGTGALDARSPFAQVQANAQRFPASATKKRPYSAFDSSPTKSRMMGSSPSKPLPPPPALNSLFSTPRKPPQEIDDSSAGETPKSPERGADSDATPEIVHGRSAMALFDQATAPTMAGAERERNSPIKERPRTDRRESMVGRLFTKAKDKLYSPGRGEVYKPEHVGGIEKHRSTKRKRDVDRRVQKKRRHSMSDSGEDHDRRSRSPRKRSGQHPPPAEKEPHWMSSLFTFIGAHPTVPHVLSFYAQFIFNVFLLGCVGYLIYCFWSAVQADVDGKAFEAMADIVAEMRRCEHNYEINQCHPATRLPAAKEACEAWERCKNRDPRKVGRAKVSATTFAEIYNSFIEPISWKAMIFTFVLVVGSFGVSNMAFGFFRQKAEQFQQPPGYGYGYGPPPPTPQRSFSGQDGQFYAGTPWHMPPQQMGFEPQPSGGYGQIEGQGSPVRRLVYN